VLASVSKMYEAGNRVVYDDEEGSCVINTNTGSRAELRKQIWVYVYMWVWNGNKMRVDALTKPIFRRLDMELI
jgi:hypothetical protein